MFTFSEMLALVQSESSSGAYVCQRRRAGLHSDSRSCYNHNNGDVACVGGSMVEYQPRLLGSWVPGPRFESGWGVCDFSVSAKASLPISLSLSCFPSSSFAFPSHYDPSFALKKRILRIYPINHNNNCVSRRCKGEHM